MRNNSLVIILLLVASSSVAQSVKLLQGRIVVDGSSPAGITILNLNSEKETRSAADGSFQIHVSAEDLLLFSAPHVDLHRKIIEQADYDQGEITVQMMGKVTELDAVVIDNRFDAVSLGILTKPAKRYTPAERRLRAATNLDAKANVGTMVGGSLSLDPLLNWISGRTKTLKLNLKVERDEMSLKLLTDLYEDDYYTERLKIKKGMIAGFRYYCIADKQFVSALKSKNKFLTAFLIGKLAGEYNNLQTDEK